MPDLDAGALRQYRAKPGKAEGQPAKAQMWAEQCCARSRATQARPLTVAQPRVPWKLLVSGPTVVDGRLTGREPMTGAQGSSAGECVACERMVPQRDDLGLCPDCAAKLDRDMIRDRDWERSWTAWQTPVDQREALRTQVVAR